MRPFTRPKARLGLEPLEPRDVPAFGTGGVVLTDLAEANHTALQADGKIVVAGGNAVARFNPDGTPDTTFNGTGVRATAGNVRDVAVAADGMIVVGGSVGISDGSDFYLERFLPDGTPDPAFSGDGVVVTGFKAKGPGVLDRISGLAVQADGKVVAVGQINGLGQWGVARFTAAGALDPSFSGDGWLTDPFDKQVRDEYPTAVAVQADGKIVVAGTAYRATTRRDLVAARYTAAGALDGSFGAGGKAWVDFGPEVGRPYTTEEKADLALAPGGGVVLSGGSGHDGLERLGVARLTADGALDPTFAGDGRLLALPPGWAHATHDNGHHLAVAADGSVVVTAHAGPSGVTAVGRITAAGAMDPTFDGDGWREFQYTAGGSSVSWDVLVQPDGKIVVVGQTYADGVARFALARFNADGSFDI